MNKNKKPPEQIKEAFYFKNRFLKKPKQRPFPLRILYLLAYNKLHKDLHLQMAYDLQDNQNHLDLFALEFG